MNLRNIRSCYEEDQPLRTGLDSLLRPRSVAVVGASENRSHSRFALHNLAQQPPPAGIFPVNPARTSVNGIQCFPTLSAIPQQVDLALIAVAQNHVMQVLADCTDVGIPAAIIIADGYRESGTAVGISAENTLEHFAKLNDITVCGPNCLGVTSTDPTVAPFCGPISTPILEGGLAVISQSGGISCAFLQAAYERHIGLSYVISSGNESCVQLCDYLDYTLEDDRVTSVCLFIETVQTPLRFLKSCALAARLQKPIVAVKIGKSHNGRLAALAHTGSIAGPEEAVAALLRRGGVMRAADIDEALDLCAVFGGLPTDLWPKGPRIGVLTKGGGPAGLIADLAESHRVDLPPLPTELAADLSEAAQGTVTVQNPIDFPGTYLERLPDLPLAFATACAGSPEFDAVVLSTLLMENAVGSMRNVAEVQRDLKKPVLITTPATTPLPDWAHAFSRETGLAIVTGVSRCIKAISAVDGWRKSLDAAGRPFPPAAASGQIAHQIYGVDGRVRPDAAESVQVLDPEQAAALLTAYGLRLVPQRFVSTQAEAHAAADEIGYPIALKAASPGVAHKTELALVEVGVADPDDLQRRLAALQRRAAGLGHQGIRFVLQQMMSGIEIFVGVQGERQGYPPTITVGPGGTAVETYGDVSTRLAPLTLLEAEEMVSELRVSRQLGGFRGRGPMDVESLCEAIVRLGYLAWHYKSHIAAIDLNPIYVRPSGGGAVIVDYLVVAAGGVASINEPTAL